MPSSSSVRPWLLSFVLAFAPLWACDGGASETGTTTTTGTSTESTGGAGTAGTTGTTSGSGATTSQGGGGTTGGSGGAKVFDKVSAVVAGEEIAFVEDGASSDLAYGQVTADDPPRLKLTGADVSGDGSVSTITIELPGMASGTFACTMDPAAGLVQVLITTPGGPFVAQNDGMFGACDVSVDTLGAVGERITGTFSATLTNGMTSMALTEGMFDVTREP